MANYRFIVRESNRKCNFHWCCIQKLHRIKISLSVYLSDCITESVVKLYFSTKLIKCKLRY